MTMPPPPRPTPTASRRLYAGVTRGQGRWPVWLFLVLIWLPFRLTAAEPAQVLVLLSETGGVYGELLEALQERLDAEAPGRIDLQSQLVPEAIGDRRELFASRPALIVSVGIRASALALQDADDLPVLSLMVPYDSYTSLLENAAAQSGRRLPHSAVYLDQPLARQLDLLQLVLPKARRIAALAGPHSAQRAGDLGVLCLQRGLKLTTETLGATDNPVPVLFQLLERAEVLLAIPDPAVFNRNNLQAILLTTYRSGVPVLGFSQAYVRAGALAAVHSTARQIGQQAGEWLAELAHSGQWRLGTPRYPVYYSVSVNRQVAQTLGIRVADEDTLLAQLRKKDRQDDIHEP